MPESTGLIELHYLPSLEYFVFLYKNQNIILETHENYQKQSYRNRCYILGPNKINILSVPIIESTKKKIIRDITIDNDQNWTNIHWRSISTAYGNAPFFVYFEEGIKSIIFKKYKYLFDLNLDLLTMCLQLLNLKRNISFSEGFDKAVAAGITDFRSRIHPKKDYKMNGIYIPCEYNQIFGKEFVNNLSILDLLFCEGASSLDIIKSSAAQ
jgi:hypothetical protein